jgi:2',3'-cyclic-nucleotide 2'-phosphodiesterase
MKILVIGDIVGKPGRQAVAAVLPELRKKEKIDFVIANAENIHHGKGVSERKLQDIFASGVDFCTSGNHVWKQAEIVDYLDRANSKLIRPANYPEKTPGRGWQIIKVGKLKVLLISLMGRVFMAQHLDCPFRTADQILKKNKLGKNVNAIIVDFHAEAGSEKVALGWYLDGRVSAVLGTHTHIATADERLLEKGTAYQTDLGMCGPFNAVIGVRKELIIQNFLSQLPVRHEVAEGPKQFNATLIELDQKTGRAKSIRRIQKILE